MDREEWLALAKERFAFDSWPSLGTAVLARRVRGFALDPTPLGGTWRLEKREAPGDHQYTDYFELAENPACRAMVDVNECVTAADARLALLELLSQSMARTLPRLEDGSVGEIAFTVHGELLRRIAFARYNVLIDARSIGDEPVSIEPLAILVDRQIQAQQ